MRRASQVRNWATPSRHCGSAGLRFGLSPPRLRAAPACTSAPPPPPPPPLPCPLISPPVCRGARLCACPRVGGGTGQPQGVAHKGWHRAARAQEGVGAGREQGGEGRGAGSGWGGMWGESAQCVRSRVRGEGSCARARGAWYAHSPRARPPARGPLAPRPPPRPESKAGSCPRPRSWALPGSLPGAARERRDSPRGAVPPILGGSAPLRCGHGCLVARRGAAGR